MKKNEKGSISLYVIVAMIFFLIFAVGAYIAISNSRVMQIKAQEQIREVYGKDVDNLEEIYNAANKTL